MRAGLYIFIFIRQTCGDDLVKVQAYKLELILDRLRDGAT